MFMPHLLLLVDSITIYEGTINSEVELYENCYYWKGILTEIEIIYLKGGKWIGRGTCYSRDQVLAGIGIPGQGVYRDQHRAILAHQKHWWKPQDHVPQTNTVLYRGCKRWPSSQGSDEADDEPVVCEDR